MNKFWKFAGVIAVLVAVVAFAGVTAAFAQGPNQPGDFTPPAGNQVQNGSDTGTGMMAVDEVTMHAAIAQALNLSSEEFEAAVAEGKTPLILAQELGIDFADVQAAMDAVHFSALQQSVDEGLVTQEQAGRMASRRSGQNVQGNEMYRGLSNSATGRMGSASGFNGDNSGDCL